MARATVPGWAHYREATVPGEACRTCDFFNSTRSVCQMFDNAPVARDAVCDKWQGRIEKLTPVYTGNKPPDPLSQSDLQMLASAANNIEPRAPGGVIPFDSPRTIAKADGVKAAGIAVRAADTGRVLLLQRPSNGRDGKDRNAGKWEFPGGRLGDGEHPYKAARREWQEEMGIRLPAGKHVGEWRHGVYQGYVHEVPAETSVKLNLDGDDRRVRNPDDPDGDNAEVAAWFHPHDMRFMRALRPELRQSKAWTHVEKAQQGTLYIVRHGKTAMNSADPSKDLVRGWKNPPLDDAGLKQARWTADFLKNKGITAIHAGPFKRTRQTAGILGRAVGVKPTVSDALTPWKLGEFEGKKSTDVTPELRRYVNDPKLEPPGGGEPFATFRDRFMPELQKILAEVKAGKTVALVTHSRNIKLLDAWLKTGGKSFDVDTFLKQKTEPAQVLALTPSGAGWRRRELADEGSVAKGQAHPATLRLRVHGVSSAPGGLRVYRMETRDGHYVGRTNPTRLRARKGDVLKVQAQDYLQDVQGDPRWTNAGVVGFDDSPHSWKELQAYAGTNRLVGKPGDSVDKDGAPGPAGDLPPAGDQGVVSVIGGDGPTLSAVHVNIPLGGISQAYVNRQTRQRFKPANNSVLQGEFLPISKAQEWKQLVYGVVLEPNSIDSQDDFMLPHHVERSAHGYLKKAIRGRSSVAKLQHGQHPGGFSKTQESIVPVESFIAPMDFSYDGKEQIKKGSWVLVMHVEDPDLWQDFLAGKYKAFSVGGSGVRRAVGGAADLVPHGLIGVQEPNYFAPDPRRIALVAGG